MKLDDDVNDSEARHLRGRDSTLSDEVEQTNNQIDSTVEFDSAAKGVKMIQDKGMEQLRTKASSDSHSIDEESSME